MNARQLASQTSWPPMRVAEQSSVENDRRAMSLPFAMNVEMPTARRKEAGLGRSSSVADQQRQSQKQRCNEVEAHLHILPDGL